MYPSAQEFPITATDLGKRPKTSSHSAKVVVYVSRNDNPPRFHGEPYTKRIQRDAGTNSGIFRVNATDRDSVVGEHIHKDHDTFTLVSKGRLLRGFAK